MLIQRLSIDVKHEDLHLLENILIPGNPSFATRYRWTLKGLRGGTKLESVLIGNRRYTSTEAVDRFLIALNAPKAQPPEISARQRSRQDTAARKKLEAVGVICTNDQRIGAETNC